MIAIITCLISGEYTLYDQSSNKTFIAKARGIFRNQKTSPKVGDIVEYTSITKKKKFSKRWIIIKPLVILLLKQQQ